MGQCTIGGIGRGHVETLHTELGRALAGRNFLAGKHTDQLLGAAGRIACRDGNHFMVLAKAPHRELHGGNGFGLVVLDTDQHSSGRQQVTEDGGAAHDLLGTLAHQQVVAGHERLALGAIDHQVFDGHGAGRGQLGMARKNSPAKAHDARVAQQLAHTFGSQTAVVERRTGNPLLTTIRLDDHRQGRQAGRMRGHMLLDSQHGAGRRRMHRCRHPAVGSTDHLPFEHLFTGLHQRIRRTAETLVERHVQA
jgi:hypothetical protein